MKKLSPETQKLFKNLIGFCFFSSIILISIEKSLSYFVSNSDDSHTGKYNLVMAHKVDPEIVIFGSSVAEVGFNVKLISEKLNKSAYNLAIDGTTIMRSKFVIDEFLDYSQKCDTILIGLVFSSFSDYNELVEPSRFLAHKSNNYVKRHIKKVAPEIYKPLYFAPFYSFVVANHTYYKNAFIGFQKITKRQSLLLDENNGSISHDVKYEDTRSADTPYKNIQVSNAAKDDFIQVIKDISNKGITPILIVMPMHKNGQASFRNYNLYTNTAKEIATETNTLLIDFSTHDIVNNELFFYNNGHLNSKGADYFSMSLIDSLSSKTQK